MGVQFGNNLRNEDCPVGLAQWESRRLSEICSGIWSPRFNPGLRQKFAEGYSPKLLSHPPVTLVFQMIFPTEEWNISHLRNRKWITKKKNKKIIAFCFVGLKNHFQVVIF